MEAIFQGLLDILTWSSLKMMLIGIPIGLLIGATPGLGGTLGLALAIPFVFGMDPVAGFALLLSLHAIVHSSGQIPAILFNTPGTGPNAAECIDGFPLAKMGQAGRALGASYVAAAMGGLIGAVFMALMIPIVRPVLLSFGPPELFMLAVLGITFISLVSGDSLTKGLMVGGLGIMMSFIGFDPQTGIIRYSMGIFFLRDGLPLVPIVLGLFAIAEVIEMIAKGGSITEGEIKVGNDVMQGVKDTLRNWWLVVRCSVIGCFIGMMPGLGAEAASFICYGHAAQTSKHPERFGKGAIEGVIAPESAVNSKEGGALLTTICLGVPGSSAMAILLGAFIVMGLTPGPNLLSEQPVLVWSMVWVLIVSNLIATAFLFACSRYLAALTKVRLTRIVPFIIVFALVGSYLVTSQVANIITTMIFGLLGYAMKKYNYPRAPIVLGFILGAMMENRLYQSLNLYGVGFVFRPITFAILTLTILSVLVPIWKNFRKRKKGEAAA